MGWPAGLKLNEEVDLFLGNIFLFYVQNWSVIAQYMSRYAPYVISMVACFGTTGLSTMISLCSDLISFVNMHIYWLYQAIAKVCSLQLRALSSLWLLFRGKKRNVLKHRIDSCDYEIDQLLLGTLLFCVLIFLIPTMGSYYLFFLVARLGLLSLDALVAFTLVMIDHFPFYLLALYTWRSKLLSGGIRFELVHNTTKRHLLLQNNENSGQIHAPSDSVYLSLKPNPKVYLSLVFSDFVHHLCKIRVHNQLL
eukprot:TRINITY_DN701_c1_g2_i2.p1 TRINITY_DN701_c1_g2~~TRINITY_DN701_c1_g2_i2.p1  ORF type:complete len:251 (+),score=24.43 TRINITY_DN701_c1_g2_i2:82-834(+)